MPKKTGARSKGRNHKRKQISTESAEIKELTARVDEEYDPTVANRFADFPLSTRTKAGLASAGFATPTEIQRNAIPVALRGRDVLGAAKTGSGKTLAFLIPMVERLWRLRWSKMDGPGAVVISPTRELAMQTFNCLAKFANKHEMSAGLIIGGTTFEREQASIPFTNVLIATPGRLLQHMDETPNFDCMNLQMLVLDEADRILDLGFAKALDAIVANMPPTRQTLLFSATQTQSVQSLARLSLQNPVLVSTDPTSATPDKLIEAYVECELEQKLDVLYSFIKTHLTEKVLVFMSSCKQVRYVYETFRRFRPGVPLMSLYGKQKQAKRVAIFNDFSKKKSAYLFATDIAARGLDFPSVDWVIQVDCPEDAETYIHRVGRTARYNKGGKAMLLLLPSEKPMIDALEKKKITLIKTDIAADKMKPIMPLLQSLCASDTELKYLAQKCFVSYMRSVYLQANKEVFNFDELHAAEYATSLGLPSAPKIKFVQKKKSKARGASTPTAPVEEGGGGMGKGKGKDKGKGKGKGKGKANDSATLSSSEDLSDSGSDDGSDDSNDDDDDDSDGGGGAAAKPAKLKAARTTASVDAMRSRKNVDVLAPHRMKMRAVQDDDDDDDGDDFLVKSSAQTHDQLEDLEDDHLTKKPANKKMEKRATTIAALKKVSSSASERSHLTFTEDGSVVNERERLVGVDTTDLPAIKKALAKEHHDLKEAAMMLEKEDILDRAAEKQRLRNKKRDRKRKRKQAEQPYAADDGDEGGYAVLGSPDSDGSDYGDDGDDADGNDDGDGDGVDEQHEDMQADEDVAMRLLGM